MEITQRLRRLHSGDRDAMHELIPLVYDELKKLARAHLKYERSTLPLQTTSLVHEAFVKLANSRHPAYENRAHFYGIASRVMRQVLVETARARAAAKRGHGQELTVSRMPDCAEEPARSVVAMEDALQDLEKADPLKGRLIEMRFFAGMTAEESAAALSLPVSVIRRELLLAQVWLRQQLADGDLSSVDSDSRSRSVTSPSQCQHDNFLNAGSPAALTED